MRTMPGSLLAKIVAGCALLAVTAVCIFLAVRMDNGKLNNSSEAAPAPRAVVNGDVIGDSLVSGTPFGGTGDANWSHLVSQQMRAQGIALDLTSRGEVGAGFVRRSPTGETFAEQVNRIHQDSDVVIVLGSRNDDVALDSLGGAADSTLAAIHHAAPQAKVIVVGAIPGTVPTPEVTAINRTLHTSAGTHGATYVDSSQWLKDPATVVQPGNNPTDLAHTELARNLFPAILAATGSHRAATAALN